MQREMNPVEFRRSLTVSFSSLITNVEVKIDGNIDGYFSYAVRQTDEIDRSE